MKESNNLSLYSKINIFDSYVRKYIIISIPKIYCDIRIHLLDEMYNIRKNNYYAIYNKGNIRIKYLTELQVNISLIDSLFTELIEFKCIKNHHLEVAISMLSEIKNITYGWKYNEEKR